MGQGVGVDTCLGVLVGDGDVLTELVDEALGGERVLTAQSLDDLVLGETHRVEAAELCPQGVEVPLVGRPSAVPALTMELTAWALKVSICGSRSSPSRTRRRSEYTFSRCSVMTSSYLRTFLRIS